ncbi:hypothetical protein H6501_02260 [Candidatus Woesearchaeota archaeon]|nr:hypothetical protein [Nanoarchaeota archaeon]MCB9370395.1 hypothetical protein [Candidatus Woesearchaeota archaeon]USN44913.1 MAG: hypothetical protein H6500_03700 [Candidatus Woesearchaeota archaeon]
MSRLLRKEKSGQGNILVGAFFLMVVLGIIFLFSQYHEIMLFSNYKINNQKLEYLNLYSVRDQLIVCHEYPLHVEDLGYCNGLEDIPYQIEIVENGLCEPQIIELGSLRRGEEKTKTERRLFIPVQFEDPITVCPALLEVFFEDREAR